MDQLSNGIQNSNFVTPSELFKIYGLVFQKRNFGYFILPASQFIESSTPTERQLKVIMTPMQINLEPQSEPKLTIFCFLQRVSSQQSM